MRIVHASLADGGGGAARAAFRLHRALRDFGVESFMTVDHATTGDWSVDGPRTGLARLVNSVRPRIGAALLRMCGASDGACRSVAVLPGGLNARLRLRGADIVHLHWLNDEMVSVAELGRLTQPVVWTLHDMWPFCGTEHYARDDGWKTGRFSGLDGWVWRRKQRHWRPMQIVAPSRWLAARAAESALMRNWPIRVIPNPIDTDRWSPVDRETARNLLGLPHDRKIVLFGAVGGTRDPRKGADLLFEALGKLNLTGASVDLAIFGALAPEDRPELGHEVHYLGRLHDAVALRLAYSAADAFVLPSRLDNLPNTGVEAQACGRPVVAFESGGLPDIVAHRKSGYLARPCDTDDLARGIAWVIEDNARRDALGAHAAEHAVRTFSAPVVAAQYKALYETLVGGRAS